MSSKPTSDNVCVDASATPPSPTSVPSSSPSTESSCRYKFTVRCPGRICLFGEHQDYLGFPVIATTTSSFGLFTELDVTVETADAMDGHGTSLIHNYQHRLPVIYLERSTESGEECGGGHNGDATMTTTVFDLNRPLPMSPTVSTADSNKTMKPDFALSALHEVLKLSSDVSGSNSTTNGNNIDKTHDVDDELISVLGPLWKFRRQNLVVKCTAKSPQTSTSTGSKSERLKQEQQQQENHLLPIQKGVSSSTAFTTAWLVVLSELCVDNRTLQSMLLSTHTILLAKLAHRSEVTHFGAPGGTMDHITIACCDRTSVVRIGDPLTGDPWHLERFSFDSNTYHHNTITAATATTTATLLQSSDDDDGGGGGGGGDDMWGVWVLADSGQPKDTFGHLHRCKNERLELLDQKLHGCWDCPEAEHDYNESSSSVALPLSDDERLLWSTTLNNRSYEEQAAEIYRRYQNPSQKHRPSVDKSVSSPGRELGRLMLRHHEALAQGLHLSTDRIEQMKDAAMNAGAWGFKLVGSGGGGCTVAWGPKRDAVKIAAAIRDVAPSQIKTWMIVDDETSCPNSTVCGGPHIDRYP